MRISDWSSDVCSSDRADDRHDDILGQRLGDRREGAADDDTDREVDDIAAGDKFPEFIQHLVVPRIVELRHRNCRDDCTKASGFLLCVLLRQNAAGGSMMTLTYRNARWLILPVAAMSLSARKSTRLNYSHYRETRQQ